MKVNFEVIRELDARKIETAGNTSHQAIERSSRMKAYKSLASEVFIYAFEVIAGREQHQNIHAININGLIYTIDLFTKRVVNVMHARPAQLKRYWKVRGLEVPKRIKQQATVNAKRNQALELNNK